MGELPANVDVVLIPMDGGPLPDLSRVDMVIPVGRAREPLIEALATGGRVRVIQTLAAGFEWLVGRVPEGVIVCNAKGVFDRPVAEWVVGAILAMQRGLVGARDAQVRGEWADFDPEELAGRRVVILGFGSIGSAVADRLRPFGVEITGVARTRRDGALGFEDLDGVLPGAQILVDLLPVTSETEGFLDARRLALLPDAGARRQRRSRPDDRDPGARRGARAGATAGGPRRHGPGAATRGSRVVEPAQRPRHPARRRELHRGVRAAVRTRRRPGQTLRRRTAAAQRGPALPPGVIARRADGDPAGDDGSS